MCGRSSKWGWLLLLVCWLGSSQLWSQSFDPAKMYPVPGYPDSKVPGSWLNRVEQDKNMLKQSLVDLSEQNKQLTSENEQLQQQIKKLSEQLAQESADRLIDSQTKQAQLTELQQQLMTSIQLLKKSENKALSDEMWVGGLSALTGGLLVEILHLMTGHF